MLTNAFDEVDWPNVHRTLNKEVPRLFQVWACKQVINIFATNKNLRHVIGMVAVIKPMLHNSFRDSGACHAMSRGWQGEGIYAVISSVRTMVGGSTHRSRLDQLHC